MFWSRDPEWMSEWLSDSNRIVLHSSRRFSPFIIQTFGLRLMSGVWHKSPYCGNGVTEEISSDRGFRVSAACSRTPGTAKPRDSLFTNFGNSIRKKSPFFERRCGVSRKAIALIWTEVSAFRFEYISEQKSFEVIMSLIRQHRYQNNIAHSKSLIVIRGEISPSDAVYQINTLIEN